jgi:hypothetical protein
MAHDPMEDRDPSLRDLCTPSVPILLPSRLRTGMSPYVKCLSFLAFVAVLLLPEYDFEIQLLGGRRRSAQGTDSGNDAQYCGGSGIRSLHCWKTPSPGTHSVRCWPRIALPVGASPKGMTCDGGPAVVCWEDGSGG